VVRQWRRWWSGGARGAMDEEEVWWRRRIARKGKRRGAAARSREVGKARHAEKGRLGLWSRGSWAAKRRKVLPRGKNDEGAGPGKRGSLRVFCFPKGP
jgi:hypothetical protein